MSNRLKPVLYLHQVMMRPPLIIFWSIVLAIQVILLVLMAVSSSEDSPSSLMLGGSGAVYVFMFITGLLTIKDTFPLALSMGATRKLYFLSTLYFYVLLALLQTVIMTLLTALEMFLDPLLEHVNLYHYRLLGTNNLLELFMFHLVLLLMITMFGNTLASWAYKFGRMFWFGFGAFAILFFTLFIIFEGFIPTYQWLASFPSYWSAIPYMLACLIVFSVLSWLPIRNVELRRI